MKISKSKIKSLVAEAMKNTLSENAPDDLKKDQSKKKSAAYNALEKGLSGIDYNDKILKDQVSQIVAAVDTHMKAKTPDAEETADAVLDALTKTGIFKAVKSADSFYAYTVYAFATKGLSSVEKEEVETVLKTRGLPRPDKAALAKSPIYKKNQKIVANSPLFKAMKSLPASPAQDSKSGFGGSEKNESKMMNENRIRAIIRHELIQSMKR